MEVTCSTYKTNCSYLNISTGRQTKQTQNIGLKQTKQSENYGQHTITHNKIKQNNVQIVDI